MKNVKIIFLLFVATFITSCSSSDDDNLISNLTVSGTIDTNALISLNGNDATALVFFNGKPAATFVTEAGVGDEVSYKINSSSANVEIVIIDFFYTSGNREFWTNGIEIFVDTKSTPTVAALKVKSGVAGDEVKFGFTFALKTNGVLDLNTTYIVDPKIKIRS
ncbi:hypothetical protein H9I45_15940 [Polaribacter haliotis]|uniref:DUF4625 domain-containing protein n=1 Tax=Polaribacter haliotis TaxID=1888915 RepID=A0A7L8AFM4_9FLAO|nr:hypothetical protein [Polaribacter haliotis]QOD60808.1 hypothetical protein H9I45_15940 [Polaribacter haliotis]